MVSKAVILLILNAVFFGFIVFTKLLSFLSAIYLTLFLVSITIYSQCDGSGLLMLLEYWGNSSDSLKGKVIWITGASSGIGKACAIKFAELKCRLVLSSRNKEKLEEVKKECIVAGNLNSSDVMVVPLDITHNNLHEQAFQSVLKHFGELDILLSNAGMLQIGSFESITADIDFDLFNLNVFGLVNLARVVTRYFLTRKKGQHVVVTSVGGKVGVPNSSSYSGSKFALHGIFESLRAEHGANGISITMLVVGLVESNISKNAVVMKTDEVVSEPYKLMKASRCATLIALATHYRLPEVYIAQQPLLTLLYFANNCTSLFQWVLNSVDGPTLLEKLRDQFEINIASS